MGAMCASSTINLPGSGETVSGTTLPAWVSAAGRSLFEQSAELAKSPYPLYKGQRIASYDGSKLTPEEQQAADLLAGSAGEYQPYIDRATELAGGLGSGTRASFTRCKNLIEVSLHLDRATLLRYLFQRKMRQSEKLVSKLWLNKTWLELTRLEVAHSVVRGLALQRLCSVLVGQKLSVI